MFPPQTAETESHREIIDEQEDEGETRHKLQDRFVVFIEQNKRAFVNIFSGGSE